MSIVSSTKVPASPSPSFAYCRICHEHGDDDKNDDVDGSPNRLLAPCLCSGSVARVHRRCLEQWLSSGGLDGDRRRQCELCGFYYAVTITDRPLLQVSSSQHVILCLLKRIR